MLSHLHTAIAPVTAIDRTMKKYSSGKAVAMTSAFQHASHPLQQGSILRKQNDGDESTRQSQQGQHQADAQVQALGIVISTATKDAGCEKPHQTGEWAVAESLPTLAGTQVKAHAAFITATISWAARTVSTSSTRRRKESSSDSPTMWGMLATEFCAITTPLRRISTSEQTFSTTSRTCE